MAFTIDDERQKLMENQRGIATKMNGKEEQGQNIISSHYKLRYKLLVGKLFLNSSLFITDRLFIVFWIMYYMLYNDVIKILDRKKRIILMFNVLKEIKGGLHRTNLPIIQ